MLIMSLAMVRMMAQEVASLRAPAIATIPEPTKARMMVHATPRISARTRARAQTLQTALTMAYAMVRAMAQAMAQLRAPTMATILEPAMERTKV